MNEEQAWRDRSTGRSRQYEFSPPSHWTSERVRAEHAAIITSLETVHSVPSSMSAGWLELAGLLPDALRCALIAELRAGNQLVGIDSMGWPCEGSIVVTVRERFSVARKTRPEGVTWSKCHDPHYWREELCQKVGQVAFLVVT